MGCESTAAPLRGISVDRVSCTCGPIRFAARAALSEPPTVASAPIKPPNYTEPRSQGNTANNQDLNSITLWQRLMGIFDRTFEDPVTFLTLCLVIANFALALSTFGLWIVTARGSKRQSKDMSKSIGVAERALGVC